MYETSFLTSNQNRVVPFRERYERGNTLRACITMALRICKFSAGSTIAIDAVPALIVQPERSWTALRQSGFGGAGSLLLLLPLTVPSSCDCVCVINQAVCNCLIPQASNVSTVSASNSCSVSVLK
ncbi:hypothetical protein V2G26_003446 [Clonostachys chloroleuca]